MVFFQKPAESIENHTTCIGDIASVWTVECDFDDEVIEKNADACSFRLLSGVIVSSIYVCISCSDSSNIQL